MQSRAETVSACLEDLEADRRSVLRRLRALIRRTVSGVKESMRYGMPTYERGRELK